MSLFNVVFLKKFIFSSSIISLSIVPVVIIKKHGFFNGEDYISRYKKEWAAGSEYGPSLKVNEFAKAIFKTESMFSVVDEIFAKDIARQFLENSKSSLHKQEFKKFKSEEAEDYRKKLDASTEKNKEQKLWDDNGGTRDSMIRRNLGDKSFDFLKKSILDFDNDNFVLNKYSTENSFSPIKNSFYVSANDLSNTEQWSKIGFYPIEDQKYKDSKDLKDFYQEKFKFLNWAHKEWFQAIKPFYTWMSLWKYKDKATAQELETYWDKSQGEIDLSKASYEFPYFENKDQNGIMSSTSKFKKFFSNIVSKDINKDIFIPREYTDDNATSIFVEGANMYSNLFVKFAAAANYKYSSIIKGANSSSNSDQNLKNQKEKTESVSNYEQPFELFFPSTSGTSIAIKIDKNIYKKSDWKNSKDKVTDIVEIKDTPWVFIRNSAGIHALAVDSYSVSKYKNNSYSLLDIYNHFNFRTLQLINKNKNELNKNIKVLDISPDAALKSFKEYLNKKFASLFLRYFFHENNNIFKFSDQTISGFKNSLEKRHAIYSRKEEYQKTIFLRQSLIREYAKKEWEKEGTTFKHVSKKYGLAGVLPYEINTDQTTDKELFKELENIYSTNFFSSSTSSEKSASSKSLLELFKEESSTYASTLSTYIDGLNLRVDPISTVMESDRVFSTNYFVNWIVDKFLDDKEAFETYLFKHHLKTHYVDKSLLGSLSFIQKNQELEITVPTTYQDNNQDNNWFDSISSDVSSETEKIKKIYGKIDNQLKSYYYSKLVLDDSNPWDLLKYSGNIAKCDTSKTKESDLTENLTKLAKTAFEEMLYFDTHKFKSKYYKFLSALVYLTKDNFEGLRKFMSSKITHFDEAWIIIEGKKQEKELASIPEMYWTSPFLNSKFTSESSFSTKTAVDPDKFLKKLAFSGFSGVYIPGSSTFGSLISGKNLDKFVTKKLFKYGSSSEEMDNFVKNISTESDLKTVIANLKTVNSSESWVNFLDLDRIYIEENSSTTGYRSLTLQEKKNLISAILNNVKVEITGGKIKKENYKKVFLADPDNSYNLLNQTHTKKTSSDSDYQDSKLSDSFKASNVKIYIGEEKEENLTLGGVQINLEYFSNIGKLKNFANSSNNSDKVGQIESKQIFWALVIELAMRFDVQELAAMELVTEDNKIKVYDGKIKSSASDKYVK